MISRTKLKNRTELFRKVLNFLILLLFISCSNTESAEVLEMEVVGETFEELEVEELVLDTSDLDQLPEDTGGQQIGYPLGTTDARFGFNLYTPGGYSDEGEEYPLIIFLHGRDALGNSTDGSLLERRTIDAPPGLINENKWNTTYPFIVASPQLSGISFWDAAQVHQFIGYLIENYQINEKRIYLTGLSLGGCLLYTSPSPRDRG